MLSSKDEQNAIGLAFIERGFKGSKIAAIGDNPRIGWAPSYYSVVCGVGVIVPIDRNLKRAKSPICCSVLMSRRYLRRLLASNDSVVTRRATSSCVIIMAGT